MHHKRRPQGKKIVLSLLAAAVVILVSLLMFKEIPVHPQPVEKALDAKAFLR